MFKIPKIKNPFDYWFLSQKWSRRFLASHLFGWTVAFIQTFWIVWEVRRMIKEISGVNNHEQSE